MGRITIHSEPAIHWQIAAAEKFKSGLKALGITASISSSRVRESDIAVLLGTTCWRNIEDTGCFLLVDRASWGNPDYVSLVWDGHGRRGNHKVPVRRGGRWERMELPLVPWRVGRRVILCGQTETWSPHYKSLESWYSQVDATHFRRHPAGTNPTGLPAARNWDDAKLAVTLNSSIGVESVLMGVPTVTMDGAAMAWDVTAHDLRVVMPDRRPWLEWLAWTQWSWDEIERGKPIAHHFEDIL